MKKIKPQVLAGYIDHTFLKADATFEDIKKICNEALKYGFYGVCVNSSFISFVSNILKNKEPIPIAVIGFPLGAMQSSSKAFEAKEAVNCGAKEIDMVLNISLLKEKEYEALYKDINAVVEEVKPFIVKVIIETALLTEEEKIVACSVAKVAKAKYVKTSTGFYKGATKEDVALMKKIVGKDMKVKASGNIKTYQDAIDMIEAGADRIGSSSSLNIIKG